MEFSAYAVKELLNWDHDINPTSLEDMAQNIHEHIVSCGGFAPDNVRVFLDKDEFVIECVHSSYFPKGSSFGNQCPAYWKRVVHASLHPTLPREHTGYVGQWIPVSVYALTDYVKQLIA